LADFDHLTGNAPGEANESGADGSPFVDSPTDTGVPEANVDGCKGREGPQPVRVGGYCIDATEVSGDDYRTFLEAKKGDTSGQPSECAWNTSWEPFVGLHGKEP